MLRVARWFVVFVILHPLGARAPQDGADPSPVPAKYALRTGGRAALADPEVGAAIGAGLNWLRDRQAGDGRWDTDAFMTILETGSKSDDPGNPVHDVGITGLALLAFLADGHTTTTGDFAEPVRAGIAWLCSQQNSRGLFGSASANEYFYSHLIATLAVVEAYGLGGDPQLKAVAQRAVTHIEKHRNPDRAWRYQPRDGENDVSVTGWAMNVLLTARDFGLEVDANALMAGDKFLLEMTDPVVGRTGYTEMGGYSARRQGEHGMRFPREMNETLTCVALFIESLLECDPLARPGMTNQIARVQKRLPDWSPEIGAVDFYAWYHGSMAMRQLGGEHWKAWSSALHTALLEHQRTDGAFTGSWDPCGPWGTDGGRIYATAMGVLSLTAWYRYAVLGEMLPLPDVPTYLSANRAWSQSRFGDFGAALDRFESSRDLDPEVVTTLARARSALDTRVARATAAVAALEESEDYVFARESLTVIEKQYGRLEAGRRADALLERYKKDKRIQNEIKAQEAVAELLQRYDGTVSSQRRRLTDGLERVRKLYPGTRGAARAFEVLGWLRQFR